jgi:hypothetical protein
MAQNLVSEAILNAKIGNWAAIERLLDKGLSIDSQDLGGFSPLIMAASAGNLEIVRLLLERGADPNIQDNEGCTALIRASRMGYAEIVELMLQRGADIHLSDIYGKAALDRARDWGRMSVVALLEGWISKRLVLSATLQRLEEPYLQPQKKTAGEAVPLLSSPEAQVIEEQNRLSALIDVEALRETAGLAEAVAGSSQSEAIRDIAEFLDDERLRVVVFGEFSAGKSTIINALLGRNALPAKARPTTGLATLICFGKPEGVRVCFVDGRTEFCPLDQLGSFVTLDMESRARDDIEAIEIDLDTPILRGRLAFIDTPGVNDSALQTHRVQRAVEGSDLVLLVLWAGQMLGTEMRQYAGEWMANELGKPVVPILNIPEWIEEKDRGELRHLLGAWTKAALTPTLGKAFFEVNAIGALRYALGVNGAARPSDDFFALKQALETLVDGNRQELLVGSRINQARAVLRRVADWNQREIAHLSEHANTLDKRREEQQSQLLHTVNDLKSWFNNEEVHVSVIVDEELRRGWEGLAKRLTSKGKTELERKSLLWFDTCLKEAVKAAESKVNERLNSVAVEANASPPEALTVMQLVHINHKASVELMVPDNSAAVGKGAVGAGLTGAAVGTAIFPIVGTLVGGLLGIVAGSIVANQATRQEPDYAAAYTKAARADWDEMASTVRQLVNQQFKTRFDELSKGLERQVADLEQAPPASEELQLRHQLRSRLAVCLNRLGC